LGLSLLLTVSPGSQPRASELFDPQLIEGTVHVVMSRSPVATPEPSTASRIAAALEAEVGDDRIEWAIHLPRLIHLWQTSDSPDRGLRWLVRALNIYNHDGLYEASLRYAEQVEASLSRMFELDRALHAAAVIGLFSCYAPLGMAERAWHVLESEGVAKIEDPERLIAVHYFLAMLHARFLPRRNQSLAEWHLDQALALIPKLTEGQAGDHFLTVFLNNGLAYVRLKQGRPDEALALCRKGFDELDEHLHPSAHRLHRSVLLFNAAQVFAGLGLMDEAIDYLTRTMEIDPNYSEYYLERGSLFLKLERYEEAERDLLRAIELSPPYAEVWTNLGQAYRAMSRMSDAVMAYDRALDLDPRLSLPLIGRAEAATELGDFGRAIADYSSALELDGRAPLVLAGRAVAQFQAGRAANALADLDLAIEMDPAMPHLFHNRAIALLELGRTVDARRDLQTYLDLNPEAEDRGYVEDRLAALVEAPAEATS
jgi:tetratricopeptide (TPR) repeat protein